MLASTKAQQQFVSCQATVQSSERRVDELLTLFNQQLQQHPGMLVFKRLVSVPALVGVRSVLGDDQCMLYSLIIATDNNWSFPHPTEEEAEELRTRLRQTVLTWSDHEYEQRKQMYEATFSSASKCRRKKTRASKCRRKKTEARGKHTTPVCAWEQGTRPTDSRVGVDVAEAAGTTRCR